MMNSIFRSTAWTKQLPVYFPITGKNLTMLDPFNRMVHRSCHIQLTKMGICYCPVIGKILVKDKTLSEVSVILKDSLNHILNQPVVTVKLVNRYVSVLGEVRNRGHFSYSRISFQFTMH